MARVTITDLADTDSLSVYADLLAKAGPQTVVKYRGLFKNHFVRLSEFPDSGAPRPELGANIRIGIVPPYIVIYKHAKRDDTVHVLRIIHGHRKITRKLPLARQQ